MACVRRLAPIPAGESQDVTNKSCYIHLRGDKNALGVTHREYILRAAVLLVTGALTINPVSIFSGNIACFGLKQGCSAETELMFDSSQLSLPKLLSFGHG